MTVRRHVPWPLRAASFAFLLVVGAAGALWLWHALVNDALFERQALREQLMLLEQQRALAEQQREAIEQQLAAEIAQRQRLALLATGADSRITVERTAAEKLAAQVRTLVAENAQLKADLAYMESLLPAGESEGVIAIRRFEVRPDGEPGRMRYRALLIQGGRSEREFEGSLQLLVGADVDGNRTALVVRPAVAGENLVKVSFRRYQRVEGLFEVPPGARVRSVQMRVLEGSAVRAQQTVML